MSDEHIQHQQAEDPVVTEVWEEQKEKAAESALQRREDPEETERWERGKEK